MQYNINNQSPHAQPDKLERLREDLIERLQYALSLKAEVLNDEEYKYGMQGIKLLSERRLARITAYIHFAILINEDFLTMEEISQNSKLLLKFTQ